MRGRIIAARVPRQTTLPENLCLGPFRFAPRAELGWTFLPTAPARLSAPLPKSRRGLRFDTILVPQRSFGFSRITERWPLESRVLVSFAPSAGATVADRHDPNHPLSALHGGHRLQTDDRLQGRSIRLPRLQCPHGAPRRARVRLHLPPLLEACFGKRPDGTGF